MTFPPIPSYPLAIDSDRTLFLVYNTSEAQTTASNSAWSQTILIEPVAADAEEIWADNGFANISGEMFYYDAVEKDGNGKVFKLKQCARNLGGKQTQHNSIGTWVRGFVVAEHHNQLVDVILNMENFIGINFSEDRATLDWRIRNLVAEDTCEDDYECPNITFEFEVLDDSSDACTGTTIQYALDIEGNFSNYRIDFGDGNFSTSSLIGTHIYAPTATIDPIVTVSNDNCQIVQTAIERDDPTEPAPGEEDTPFDIPIPAPPDFPTFTIPDCVIPETTFTFPPFVPPCDVFPGFGGISVPSIIILEPPIPSVIQINPIIPTEITFVNVPNIPTTINITPSVISVVDSIPSVISVVDSIPSVISVVDSVPDTITLIGTVPNIISLVGTVPTEITLIGTVPDEITVIDTIPVEISLIDNLPDEISLIDNLPDVISLIDNLPDVISVEHNLPSVITIEGTVPSVISIDWGPIPSVNINWGEPPVCSVEIICPGGGGGFRAAAMQSDYVDTFTESDAETLGIPSVINLVVPDETEFKLTHDLPSFIELRLPDNFLEISVTGMPHELKITGLPEFIEIRGNIPTEIVLRPPENLEIPLVFRGDPIPVQMMPPLQVQFNGKIPTQENGEPYPCFALVPCGT